MPGHKESNETQGNGKGELGTQARRKQGHQEEGSVTVLYLGMSSEFRFTYQNFLHLVQLYF